jgi:nucleoside triphosphate pyrophosphatase
MRKDFVYLASASPRRSDLLRQLGVRFEVRPATISEEHRPGEAPEEYVSRLAKAKARAVAATLREHERAPVLAADTAVVLGNEVLGKPADAAEAKAMLERLSGRSHRVLTAVALDLGTEVESLRSDSEVRFRATTADERVAYCSTGEPLDKAGGYGIQGHAAVFVESLQGSYSGVVGLPLFETAALLERAGVGFWLTASRAA